MSGVPKLTFEDFAVGQVRRFGSTTIDRDDVVRFATAYDPQPFHIDEAAARASYYGGLIASGWHTCALAMRQMVDGFLTDVDAFGSPGVDEIRWPQPVRPGDTLSFESEVVEARASRSKPDRGIVVSETRARNQHGEVVLTMRGMTMVKRRA